MQDNAGFQLDRVQRGLAPQNFSPEPEVGNGVYKIRVHARGGTFRVYYLARFEEAVYILHCFKKKATRGISTPKRHIDLARRRYRAVVAGRPALER